MVSPISASTAFDFGAAAQATAAQPQTTTTAAAPVKPPIRIEPAGDTVKLSPRAQVRFLKTQGQTVAQIAVNTALSAATVNSYLGITAAPVSTVAANNK